MLLSPGLNQRGHSASNKAVQAVAEINVSMQNVLMQLRKCCNHPYLLKYPLTKKVVRWLVRLTHPLLCKFQANHALLLLCLFCCCCCCCFVVFFLFFFVFWVLSCSLFLFDGFGERVFARERYCAEAESKNAVGEWRYYHF